MTLRGHVRTFHEKQLGGHVARRVAGVVRLVDDVQVAAESFSSPRSLWTEIRREGDFAASRSGLAGGVDLDPVSPQFKEGH